MTSVYVQFSRYEHHRLREPMTTRTGEALHAIGYRRVSTRDQADEGHGLDAQTDALERWAEYRGAALDLVTDEAVSGSVAPLDRPALSEALRRLADRTDPANALVVSKLDRASRDTRDLLDLVESATGEGWHLVLLDLDVDATTPVGELMLTVLVAISRFERRRIGERISEALRAKQARGERVGRPVLLADDVADLIHDLRDEGLTYAAIAAELAAENIPTATGRGTWSITAVRRVLLRGRPTSGAAP